MANLSQVVKGRGLPVAQVRQLAKGRIWTGEAALEHKLVDKLGGLPEAIHLAKQHAGLALEVLLLMIVHPCSVGLLPCNACADWCLQLALLPLLGTQRLPLCRCSANWRLAT